MFAPPADLRLRAVVRLATQIKVTARCMGLTLREGSSPIRTQREFLEDLRAAFRSSEQVRQSWSSLAGALVQAPDQVARERFAHSGDHQLLRQVVVIEFEYISAKGKSEDLGRD